MTEEAVRQRLVSLFDALTEVLTGIASQVRTLQDPEPPSPTEESGIVERVGDVVNRAFLRHPEALVGAGTAWESRGPGGEAALLWWRVLDGELTPKQHIFNPRSDSYYDYQRAPWYERARTSDDMVIVGPFIDAWGTDEHTLTASLAIRDDAGNFLGVAALDLEVSPVAAIITAAMDESDHLAVVNLDGQIVAASHPLLTPGVRLERFASTHHKHVEQADVDLPNWRIFRVIDA